MVSYSDDNSLNFDSGNDAPADDSPTNSLSITHNLAVESSPTDPEGPAQPQSGPAHEPPVDDLEQLLSILPPSIRSRLAHHSERQNLIEVVLDLGRLPEARFYNSVEYLSDTPVTHADLDHCIKRVGSFGGDNRAGIEKTLHRISAIRNRSGEVIGLTCRVGRAIFGTIGMIRDLVETGRSILMLGRPGVGKTTALREIARVLADDLQKRVVIIDTSNEIAGDGDIPHPAIGRARRMQVARPEEQHRVMIEAVENHMPEVIVIDEIGTELEALAARTIAERGVQLVGTAHGNRLENLIKNPTLSDLIGGIQSVTLGDEEARRRGSQKSVLERKAPPTFDIAVEMLERQRWAVHDDVTVTIDNLLRGAAAGAANPTIDENQKVVVTLELPVSGREVAKPSRSGMGWRAAGQMVPPASPAIAQRTLGNGNIRPLGRRLSLNPPPTPCLPTCWIWLTMTPSLAHQRGRRHAPFTLRPQPSPDRAGHSNPAHAGGDHQRLRACRSVLALRSHAKAQAKLKHMAQGLQIPVHLVKSNSIPRLPAPYSACWIWTTTPAR
jgi:stage III sporulation protein SpoIIIAA